MSRTWWVRRLFGRRTTFATRSAARPGLVWLEERVNPVTLFALDNLNTLVRFDSVTPGTILGTATITGLQPGEEVVGIDTRPATGQLYAYGQVDDGTTRTGRIYTVDPATGAATQVGGAPFSTTLPDSTFGGFNFNPNVDLIRVISDTGTSLRVSPNSGALVGTDTNTSQTGLNGVSYTNNDGLSSTTTLYGVDFPNDKLVTVGGLNGSPSPNTGQVFTVGATGVVSSNAYGMEITSAGGVTTAYAVANEKLYTVDLSTGTFSLVGAVGGPAVNYLSLTAALSTIAVAGSAANDSLVVTATDATSGSYSLNAGPAVPFAGVTSFSFLGGAGSDSLTVQNPAGGLFAPAGGVRYFGGAGVGDKLAVYGGASTAQTFTLLPDDATGHRGTIQLTNGVVTAGYTYSDLEPVLVNAGTPTTIIFNLPAGDGDNQAVLEDDGTAGDGVSRLRSGAATFETTDFAAPSGSLTVNLSNDGETLTLAGLDAAFAAPVSLIGGAGADTVNLVRAAVPVSVRTGGGLDAVNVGNGGVVGSPGLLTPLAAAVTVDGEAGGAILTVDDSGAGVAANYGVSATAVTQSTPTGFGGVTYSNITSLLLTVGSGANVVDVTSTKIPTTVRTNAGADSVFVTGAGLGAALQVDTGSENDAVTLIGVPAQSVTVDGGTGTDTLTGPDGGAAFSIAGANAGSVSGATFAAVENLTGGTGNDTFTFADGAGVSGLVDGGAGTDALDYAAYSTGVRVNLGANAPGFVAGLEGAQEVPAVVTPAAGTASLTYDPATGLFTVSVTVTALDPATVTGFHVHRGAFGVNGPVVVGLLGLAPLVPAGSGFTFTAVGVALPAINEAALLGGIAYLNIHTAASPGGLIRGQLFPTAAFVNVPGVATGTGGVSNVENATGGSAADSLVGSNLPNMLSGLGGNDTLVGARGNDTVSGGAANDVLVWSNGDNSDLLDGGAGTDLVQVNGAVSAGDVFTVGPNGPRVAFARTNLVPFALDIGTVETLTVNGIGGDDTFTAKNLAGVADLTQLSLNGLDGNDTFTVAPSPTVAVRVNGFSPVAPTLPGDTLTLDAENNTLSQTPGADASSGVLSVPGRLPVTFVSIETLAAVNVSATLVTGTNGDDTVVLFKTAGGQTVYTFNGGLALPVFGPAFQFNGLAGKDVLEVDYTVGGDPLSGLTKGVTFDGTNKAGDTLVLFGSGTQAATYVADKTESGKGTLSVTDGASTGVVSFRNLSPVDVSNLAKYTVSPAGATNVLLVADGKDFLTNSQPAVVISGTTDGFAIEPTSARNVGELVIDTAGTGAADTVTLGPVSTDPAVASLTVRTGIGADVVTASGSIGLTGTLSIDSKDVNLLSFISVGGSAAFVNSGTLVLNDATVIASGPITQTGGPVTLAGTESVLFTPFSTISLQGAIDAAVAGTSKLSATANDPTLGVLTLSGSVGVTSRPDSLFLTGGKQISLGSATYRTTGDQVFNGPVRVSAAAVGFTSGTLVQFQPNTAGEPVLNGASAVTAAAPGGVTFGGPVGSLTPLASLAIAAGSPADLGGDVTTVGPQTYTGPVGLAANATLKTTAAAGDVLFASTVDTIPFVGNFGLTVNTPGGGTTTFARDVGQGFGTSGRLAYLKTDAAGVTVLGTAATPPAVLTVNVGGPVAFADPVRLGFNVLIQTPGTVGFGSTVDAVPANGSVLTVAGGAGVRFGGFVGGTGRVRAVFACTADPGAVIAIDGGGATVRDSVSFGGPVVLGADATFTAADPNGTVAFDTSAAGTGLDSAAGGPFGATVRAGATGLALFRGPVGAARPLAFLRVGPTGTIAVQGGLVSTVGDQVYDGPVTVSQGTTFRSVTAAGASPGTGPITFKGSLTALPVGSPVTVTTAGPVAFFGPVTAASLQTLYGPVDINGGSVFTPGGPQLYGGPVLLSAHTLLTAGTSVTFLSTLDSNAAGPYTLDINSPATIFRGAVGRRTAGATPLQYLNVSGTASVASNMRTVGFQRYSGLVTLTGPLSTFDTVLAPGFTAVGTGPVTFAGTLDGGAGVLVRTSGDTMFGGSVGGIVSLAGLVTDGGGTTRVNGGLVRTTGDQAYADAVRIGADARFIAGGAVSFGSTLDGPFAATVTAPGATTFGGKVGGITPLASLTADGGGTTAVAGGLVVTIGSQTFADDVTLGTDALFTSAAAGAIAFAGRLDATALGAQGARVATAGVTTFGGPVGGLRPLAFLTADGGGTTAVAGGLVQTTGPQNYLDPVSAPGDVTFQTADPGTGAVPGTGAIRFLDPSPASLTAGGVVTICTLGPIVFEGGVTAAGLRLECAGGSIDLNGGSIATAGEQVYASDVVLTEDLVLTASRVNFGGRVDSDLASNWKLAVAGDAVFGLQVGGAQAAGISGRQPLGRLDVAGSTLLGGGLVRTTDQPNSAFPGSGSQNYGGPVSITRSTLFEAVGSKTGAVRFLGTLDAALPDFGVTVTTAGLTEFTGSVGGTGPLGSLTTDGGGVTIIYGTQVRTVLGQTYRDAVRLDGPAVGFTSLAGGDIRFADRLDSLPFTNTAVTVTTGGAVRFEAPVGKLLNPLRGLTTAGSGTTFVSGGDIFTMGNQRYGQPVRLVTDTTFTASGEVNFDSRLDAAAPGGAAATVNTFSHTRFAGPVGSENPLATLTTDNPGVVFFAGGLVRTAGDQSYLDPAVTQTSTQFTSDGGAVRFGQTLDGPGAVVVAAGQTTFGGAVGGTTPPEVVQVSGPATVAGGLVRAATAVRFLGPVTATADTTFATTAAGLGVEISFGSTLTATGKAVVVNSAGRTAFGGDVVVGSLTTDATGATTVATPNVTATDAVDFGDRVELSNNPVTVRGGSVRFRQTVNGPGDALTVLSPGVTRFDGPVVLLALATDTPGTTELNGVSVSTAAGQTYGDPVTLVQSTRFDAGGSVTFQQSLTGPADAVLNVAFETVFNGVVNVGSLATDAPGLTRVNGGSVTTAGGQQFGDAVRVDGLPATFVAGGAVLFNSSLDGPQSATVTAPGDTVFGADVGGLTPLAAVTLNGGGRTILRGSQVRTTGDQDYADKVLVDGPAAIALHGANITLRDDFTSPVPVAVEASGKLTQTGGTLSAPAVTATVGSATFAGSVTASSSLAVTASGTVSQTAGTLSAPALSVKAASVALAGTVTAGLLTLDAGGGTTQTGGKATAGNLVLLGAGETALDRAANDFDTLTANLSGGTLRLSDAGDLSLGAAGVSLAGGGFVRVRTGGSFTAPATSTVSIPGGQLVVYPGLNPTKLDGTTDTQGATVRYAATTTASQVVLGRPTAAIDRPAVATSGALPDEPVSPTAAGFQADANTGRDTFVVRPVAGTPIFVYGNEPRTVPGDRLLPDFAGRAVVQFSYDGKDGFYVLGDGAVLRFSSIESLSGLSLAAFVAQTGEPRDASGAASQQYAVRAVRTQNGTVLTGGLKGARLPDNPFVVSPALVNPAAPTQSPRLAFGDFNGDNVPDLVLANGPGTPPLVTVIDGTAIDLLPDGSLSDIATLQSRRGRNGQSLILAQFYAYDPGFQGGVNVAVGNLGGGGLTIVTGADEGGGPHVRSFRLVPQTGQANPFGAVPVSNPFGSFYGYEAAFGGGVRVAVADVTGDGKDDLILVPGAGGGPRVRVYDGAAVLAANAPLSRDAASYADFFTVEESFRGGLFVAAGQYRSDAKQADIIVGAAGGGGPRVMIFAGDTVRQAKPTVLADFFAFTTLEQSDRLFGQAGYFTGVGGVSFGGRGGSGFLDVLASTGRGPQLTVRQFDGGPNLTAATPTRSDLTNAPATLIPPLVDVNGVRLDPDRLNYGATVGGFVDPAL